MPPFQTFTAILQEKKQLTEDVFFLSFSAPEEFIFQAGQFVTIVLEKLTGKKAEIMENPRNPADVLTTYADITKAKKLLGWEPKTKLEDGLKLFIDWYRATIQK